MSLEKIYNNLYFFDDFLNFKKRYNVLMKSFNKYFGQNKKGLYYFSVPGRVEIIGNHTDHNRGKVIATSINLDIISIAAKTDTDVIKIYSIEFDEFFEVDLKNLNIREEEKNSTNALIRGIAAGFKKYNKAIGGFSAVISSEILVGSGLSSSAAFEVLIGEIFNIFYNNNNLSDMFLANVGQFSENKYFGKPCGLMDQIAVAHGGIVFIDFADSEEPFVQSLDFDFNEYDYRLLVIDTGGNHVDLTDDYSNIYSDMKKIAGFFNKTALRDIQKTDIYNFFLELRSKFGDRAVLRALHFFDENNRVEIVRKNFLDSNIEFVFNNMILSGESSIKWLQNSFSIRDIRHQGLMLGIYLTKDFFKKRNILGSYRIHGGGFAGTILVILKNEFVKDYVDFINMFFSRNAVNILRERKIGVYYTQL